MRKKSGPKPRLKITSEMLEEVKVLSGRGLTQEQIYKYYRVSNATWYNYIQKYPELGNAIAEGRSKTISFVSGKLMELIKLGNLSAIIFYLKTRGGYTEDKIDNDRNLSANNDNPNSLTLTVTDPVEAAKIYQKIMLGS
jgi:hypothetical protein